MPPKLVVITGPTATGKTHLGVELALALNGEVVSADSMQIYRGMDIGTAKPAPAELRGVPHHLLDVADPGESWSAARWVEAADSAIAGILARGRLPIIVGGTNLYIDALIAGREFAGRSEDGVLRAELTAEYDRIGGEAFREKLRAVDPDRAEKLPPGDRRRLVRAMEVFLVTGETITAHDARTRALPPRYDAAKLALDFTDRARLYARIDRRVEQMVRQGLFAETRALLDRGISSDATAMQAIGYKEAAMALRGEISPEAAVALIQQESRRYAKRQLTWLRRDPAIYWLRWADEPNFAQGRLASTAFLAARGIQ